uniref:ATP synthase F0 subunit 8 n=1 Tax=Ceriagrion auranticum TaxID=410880 RepID=UPI0026E2D7AA|nr:ATP synthase F0 subunit 8 [Ceriagrion auranticum]WJK72283.1 ATP synthase F0 subunit 8 [Ceriagrion auranticum]
MPQMAPMSWMMLFTFFTMMFIIIMTMNYYIYIPKMEKMEKEDIFSNKTMNWKW